MSGSNTSMTLVPNAYAKIVNDFVVAKKHHRKSLDLTSSLPSIPELPVLDESSTSPYILRKSTDLSSSSLIDSTSLNTDTLSIPPTPSLEESTSRNNSSPDLADQPLLVLSMSDSIKDIYANRNALFAIWDIYKKRIDCVLNEYDDYVKQNNKAKISEKEELLATLYGQFYALSSALIQLNQKENNRDNTLGVYINESSYSQYLYALVEVYYNLGIRFTNPFSEVNRKINKDKPQDFFGDDDYWGGVSKQNNNFIVNLYSETITQYISKDLFIFVNNLRLFTLRFKNFSLYLDKGLTSFINFDPNNFLHVFATNFDTAIKPVFTILAWAYYLPRIVFNLFFLLKHTIPGPWMNQYEKDLGWQLRLANEVNKRGFQLANDIVWFTIGMIVFAVPMSVPLASILTASLYVFDVINTIFWAKRELGQLADIRKKYVNQIVSEIKSKLPQNAENDELIAAIIKHLKASHIKQFNLGELWNDPRFSQLSDKDRKELIATVTELKEQLLLVDEKIVAREKLYHTNLAFNSVFMGGMIVVAAGFCTGLPLIYAIGIAIVFVNAAIQLGMAIYDKIQKNIKPTPQSFFFKEDGSVKKFEMPSYTKPANDEHIYYGHNVALGLR